MNSILPPSEESSYSDPLSTFRDFRNKILNHADARIYAINLHNQHLASCFTGTQLTRRVSNITQIAPLPQEAHIAQNIAYLLDGSNAKGKIVNIAVDSEIIPYEVRDVAVHPEGLLAYLLVDPDTMHPPRILFRGTSISPIPYSSEEDQKSITSGLEADLSPHGVGLHAYMETKETLFSWVDTLKKEGYLDEQGIIISGHSLGGIQAQYLALQLAKIDPKLIKQVYTFSSPKPDHGVFPRTSSELEKALRKKVIHVVYSSKKSGINDFVTLVGNENIPGLVIRFHVDDKDLHSAKSLVGFIKHKRLPSYTISYGKESLGVTNKVISFVLNSLFFTLKNTLFSLLFPFSDRIIPSYDTTPYHTKFAGKYLL